MSFGNLAERPDLRPLFGDLTSDENERLLDRLLTIDARLAQLAEHASAHVGVPYKALGLGLVIREDGSAAGIHGGPSGDAGDIWFDISPYFDPESRREAAPPWVVVSRLVVFCSDSPEPPGEANTHDLVCLNGTGAAPAEVLDILESHVSHIAVEIDRYAPEVFTNMPHARLP